MSASLSEVEENEWLRDVKIKKSRPVGEVGKYTVGDVELPKKVDADTVNDVINAAVAAYQTSQAIPNIRDIKRYAPEDISEAMIKRVLGWEGYAPAMVSRGVPVHNFNGLTSEQLLVAQIVTNPTDRRSLREKLRSAGVTYQQYRNWMQQPRFSQYMNKISEGMLLDHVPDFNNVLVTKALNGDLKALQYINELSGRHDPDAKKAQDLMGVIEKLLDIILRNVTDQDTLSRITQEFSLAMSASGMGPKAIKGEISNGPHN